MAFESDTALFAARAGVRVGRDITLTADFLALLVVGPAVLLGGVFGSGS